MCLGDRTRCARHSGMSSRASRSRRGDRRSRLYDSRRVTRRSTVAGRSAAAGRGRRRLLLRRRRVRQRSHVRGRVGDGYLIRRRLPRRRPRRGVTGRARREHRESRDEDERENNLRASCTHPRWMSADGGHAVSVSEPSPSRTRSRPFERRGRLSLRLVGRFAAIHPVLARRPTSPEFSLRALRAVRHDERRAEGGYVHPPALPLVLPGAPAFLA